MPLPNPVDITFGGKTTLAEGTNFFDLELGTSPSRGVVTMYASDLNALELEDTGHTFKIKDSDGRTVDITNLFVVQAKVIGSNVREKPIDSPDSVVEVHLEDQRSKWKWKTISGQFNVLKEDGITYRANTVTGTTPFTLDQLLAKVFTALGITVAEKTDLSYIPQNVKWEFANAASALEALLAEVGWSIAWQIDDTFSLIDLDNPPQAFSVSGGFTIVDQTVEDRDVAHDKPATARVAYRVMRKQEFVFSPVLKHDGKSGPNSDSQTVSGKASEWVAAETVLSEWGSSLTQAQQKYYRWFSQGKATQQAVRDLGGGATGLARAQAIAAQLYKVFRLEDTDRTKILPLLPLTPEISSAVGREVWLGVEPGTTLNYHVLSRENRGVRGPVGSPKHNLLVPISGQPQFPLKLVDPQEGVVAFTTPPPLFPPVTGISSIGNGFLPPDFALNPSTVRIAVGFIKKFSSATDPEADYFIVSKDLGGENNGETKTFRAGQAWLLEVFTSGAFVASNQTELETSANAFLDAYARGFDLPSPEQITVEGVHTQKTLTPDVRGIKWNATDGISTVFALYTVTSFNPFALPPGVRSKQFAQAADQAILWNPSNISGGSNGNADVGSLENVSPLLKDHGTTERSQVAMGGWGVDFITDQSLGLLVASDKTLPASGKDPCEGEPQLTTPGRGQVTKVPGQASNPTGGGTQTTSGGPTSSSGGAAGGAGGGGPGG